ncbi:MAG TPA: hypothetical protein PKC58_05060 [Ignavibacteria bacterium]|nr:hypothetical protein [Ignavibacteria bacterium]
MKIRKFLIAVFIILSVNFSFQPVTFYIRERQSVVYTVKTGRNRITDDFLNQNETKRFYVLVSLNFRISVCDTDRNKNG